MIVDQLIWASLFFLHGAVNLFLDALRFASLGLLRSRVEKKFNGDEARIKKTMGRLEHCFFQDGRNLRELEWASHILLLTLIVSGMHTLELSSHDFKEVFYIGFSILLLNQLLLRIFSEPFAESIVYWSMPLWYFVHFALWLPSNLLRLLQVAIVRIAGVQEEEESESEQRVLDSMSDGEKAGVFEDSERMMIANIIEFKDLSASEVMTPRTEVVAVKLDSAVTEIIDKMVKDNYSRILVYEGNRDNVVGFLHVRDFLPYWHKDSELPELNTLLHPIMFVPESKKIRDLFQEFKVSHQHIAVVIDEYGGTAGLITIEDILEEIVGEIVDEHQDNEEEAFVELSQKEVKVSAKLRIAELNERFNTDLPESDDYDSVGGWLIAELGRIPGVGEQGEALKVGLKYRILEASDRKLESIHLAKIDERADAS